MTEGGRRKDRGPNFLGLVCTTEALLVSLDCQLLSRCPWAWRWDLKRPLSSSAAHKREVEEKVCL